MRERYGEGTNAWRTRVTGEFPVHDDDTVIPLHLVESAIHRYIEAADGVTAVWSLDVARMGDDASVLCKRVCRVVTDMRVWRKLDLMQLSGSVMAEYEALPPS